MRPVLKHSTCQRATACVLKRQEAVFTAKALDLTIKSCLDRCFLGSLKTGVPCTVEELVQLKSSHKTSASPSAVSADSPNFCLSMSSNTLKSGALRAEGAIYKPRSSVFALEVGALPAQYLSAYSLVSAEFRFQHNELRLAIDASGRSWAGLSRA